jgi:hypothetical protein
LNAPISVNGATPARHGLPSGCHGIRSAACYPAKHQRLGTAGIPDVRSGKRSQRQPQLMHVVGPSREARSRSGRAPSDTASPAHFQPIGESAPLSASQTKFGPAERHVAEVSPSRRTTPTVMERLPLRSMSVGVVSPIWPGGLGGLHRLARTLSGCLATNLVAHAPLGSHPQRDGEGNLLWRVSGSFRGEQYMARPAVGRIQVVVATPRWWRCRVAA